MPNGSIGDASVGSNGWQPTEVCARPPEAIRTINRAGILNRRSNLVLRSWLGCSRQGRARRFSIICGFGIRRGLLRWVLRVRLPDAVGSDS